jgi:divalent metal cation (Fe/Co/Zn/Cd) transporter
MNLAIIIVGIFSLFVSFIMIYRGQQNPDELIDYGFGEYKTHGRVFFEALVILVFGVFLLVMGILVP